ncbi:MAG: AAA family ATPase [Verrucomicrobia bacterium]|nr:AAA family ATPase [Verrucomicrobiota bacterium]
MKSRLQKIEITNFKAFREFTLNLEGRHLLLYGANGAGKSSLYWSLYTFLQSAAKTTPGVAKYFDPSDDQRLLNIHEDAVSKPGEIAITLRDTTTRNDTIYRISYTDHGTRNQPAILKGDLASDFITYRFFFGFSHFSNKVSFDLWDLFEKEILPFCVSTGGGGRMPKQMWDAIKDENPNPYASRGLGGTYAYDEFKANTQAFATILPGIVDGISKEAQAFYDRHFSSGDKAKIILKLGVTQNVAANGSSLHDFSFTRPKIEFGIKVDGTAIERPQSFLNEAKLTQLALSVRFAASMVNLHESDLKLLVLDDLLVSLDMDNRMKVVEILLGPDFESYQKIILTHDRGFFEEFRRVIGDRHTEWCFRSLLGNSKDGIRDKIEKGAIQRAADYIQSHDLEAAAVLLRKAAEETAKRYRRVAMGEISAPGDFHSLSQDLKAAKNHLMQKLPMTLYNQAIKGVPKAHRDKLVCASDEDIDTDATLDLPTKNIIKAQRKRLKQFLSQEAWRNLEAVEAVDAIIQMKDRVLNPAAHWNESPLYDAELKKALRLVSAFERSLSNPTI